MRYTESRLSQYSSLLLSELSLGTVNYVPNYDSTEKEPEQLPARLPFLLMNGSIGVAVGMATKIPSHNMVEVCKAAVAIFKDKIKATDSLDKQISLLMQHIQGPDFPGAAQIITPPSDIEAIYKVGRGSIRLRAKWEIEQMARGQWRIIITQLPYEVSAKDVITKLAEMSDPKISPKRKELTTQQKALKQLTNDYIDTIRDESGKDYDVRIVIEPKSSKVDQNQMIAFLLANTDLETSFSLNMTAIGLDSKPQQKNLYQILKEWTDYRFNTVTKRTQHRLQQLLDRIHILEGRMIAYLNIEKVIKVIRESEDPQPDLMAAFNLTEIQAKDILEIRLRQLAKLEGIKIENDIADARKEAAELQHLLDNRDAMVTLIVDEINSDVKKYGDERRTLIEGAPDFTVSAPTLADEAITVVLSKNGWLRQKTGHDLDVSTLTFKDGDACNVIIKTRTINPLIAIDNTGRAYTLPVQEIPSLRGDGIPVASLIELQPKTKVVTLISSAPIDKYLFSTSSGYGFITKLSDIVSRQKAGRAFMKLQSDESVNHPALLMPLHTHVVTISTENKIIVFPLDQVKELNGGRGVTLQKISEGHTLGTIFALSLDDSIMFDGQGKQGKIYKEFIKPKDLQLYFF